VKRAARKAHPAISESANRPARVQASPRGVVYWRLPIQMFVPLRVVPDFHLDDAARLLFFLRAEIAADRCDVHRLPGSRIVDPEPVDQEGYWPPPIQNA
jgi:hypothetical protein